jgi:multidrug efflux pump
MREALGTVVFYGMIGVTAFGLFLTPVFYTVIRKLLGDKPIRAPGKGHGIHH